MNEYLNDIKKRTIKKSVSNILRQFDLENNVSIDTVKLAKSVGFKIGESDKLNSQDDGFIFVSPDETDKIMGINYYRSIEEKRFITAYQLAYYFLYPEEIKEKIFFKNNLENKKEDVHYFAKCLLKKEELKKNKRKENNTMDLYLRNINDDKIYKIYDVSYNSAGYPHFLIFKGNEWIRMSAKYFRPIEEK